MKFRMKIMLSMLCLLSVLFGTGGNLLITISFYNSLEREQVSVYNAYQMALGTLQVVGSVNGRLNDSDISETLSQLSGQNADSWTALRLYTSSRSIYEENSFPQSVTAGLPPVGKCEIKYVRSEQHNHILTLSGALDAGGETLYLDMSRDISPIFEAKRAQQKIYQWVFMLLTALCALLSYSIARILTRPLANLSRASRAISAGQLSCRARVDSTDEVGLVARDFNSMAEHMEQNIEDLKASMERQEQFMGSFAHELKTPMTSIIGYADLIRGQTLSRDEQLQAANYIVSEGKRLDNLSHKLLDILVLKQEKPEFLPAQPAKLIQGLYEHLNPLYARQGIDLTCECEEGSSLMEPDLIKSLLVNLWDNARKAMNGRGGSIHTRLSLTEDGCIITVKDSGNGIPPEALKHLTEAFYRVDKSRSREQGGVGLGLALCHEIASLHNGEIHFESAVDIGTTVTVTLRGGRI